MERKFRRGRSASLVAEFVGGITALLVVSSLASLLFFNLIARRAFLERLRREGFSLARTVAAGSGYYIDFRLEGNLKDIAQSLLVNSSVDYVEFLDADGHVLAQSDPTRRPKEMASGAKESASQDHFLFSVPVADTPADARVLDRLGASSRAGLAAIPSSTLVNAGVAAAEVENFRRSAIVGTLRLSMNTSDWQTIRRTVWSGGMLLTAVILAVGVVLIVIVARIMIRPLTVMAKSAETMASGDLTSRIETPHRNEIGVLASAFNSMAEGISGIVGRIRDGQARVREVAGSIRKGSRSVGERAELQNAVVDEASLSIESMDRETRGISERMEDVSASAEETGSSILEMAASLEEVSQHMDALHASIEEMSAAAVETAQSISAIDGSLESLSSFAAETATSMAEIDASIRQVRENARKSAELSEGAEHDAEGGQEAVEQTVSAMGAMQTAVGTVSAQMSSLAERSRQIGKIVSMIDDVAGETHLLALNAAILAAQAGEEGKGFAVLASEIRALSDRASTGASEITDLLSSIQQDVASVAEALRDAVRRAEDGTARSEGATGRLAKILDRSKRASESAAEIARATAEQSEGSHRVATAIDRVREQISQIAAATSQQRGGARHVEGAIVAMRERSSSIKGALREQKHAGDSIAQAAESTLGRIREVVDSTDRQRAESARMVELVSRVRRQSGENAESAAAVGTAVSELLAEIEALEGQIARFRVPGSNA